MVYDEDNIVKFEVDNASGDTTIERYHDSDGDGSADVISPATEPVPFETVLLSELDPQWEAGKRLALRDASTRTIKTWIDPNGNGVVDAGEVIDFTTANAARLRPFLAVATVAEAEDIIDFIRGEEVAGYRDRNITIGGNQYVWKLSDIVYSTPTVVGKPMEMYNLYYSDVTYAEFYHHQARIALPEVRQPLEVLHARGFGLLLDQLAQQLDGGRKVALGDQPFAL